MSTVPAGTKKITLKTSDNHEFEVDEAIAMKLGIVKTFFDENPDTSDDPVPLPNVSSKCLTKIIEYCKFHLPGRLLADSSSDDDETFDEDMVKALDNESLIELILAVNYLDIKDMLDMLNQAAADRIKNKSVAYVRKFFGVENDYTPEEEAAVRAPNEWALKASILTKIDWFCFIGLSPYKLH